MFDNRKIGTATISRRALMAGITSLAASPLLAQTVAKPRYAVMSIIGDKITLIGYRPPTGSNVDQNDKRILAISGPALDNSTLLSVDDAVKRQAPQAETTLLAARDPKLYELQDQSFDSPPAEAAASVAAIKALLAKTQADRLILVAPYRSEARFRTRESFVGSGKIAGLGVYLDRVTMLTTTDTGELGAGYIAPYAYFSLSLIDAKTLTTIKRKLVLESETLATSAVQTATVPWDVLSNQKKIEMLEMLVQRGINKALPDLLAGA